jgi:hypothetical protein
MSKRLKELEITVTRYLSDEKSLTRADILKYVDKFAPLYGESGKAEPSKEERESIVRNIESKLTTTMSEGIALVDMEAKHDDGWHIKRKNIEWNYWEDYVQQLNSGGWPPKVVSTLDDVTNKILGLLKNPEEKSNWDRRGLVIGHVQSGKTANYIGLITKAADAGYKFIIVIAGTQNNLRKQTQQRINEGFVGRDRTTDGERTRVGVGKFSPNRNFPITLTTTDGDFTKQMANQLGAGLQDFSRPVVVVIKKNVNTLKNLCGWIGDWSVKGANERVLDIPMLMIDDEADNASINTQNDECDPTRTNKEIRQILKLFSKRCYVAYTATPFATIFINPDTRDEMLGDDLFPRDFIYCLDTPTNYFGPAKIFLDEETSDDSDKESINNTLCIINDAEKDIPLSHKKNHDIKNIPSSMKQAIHCFVIGKAVRILRGQQKKHCSMMVNASRFVDVQQQIKEHVSYYIKTLGIAAKYNCTLPEREALKEEHLADIKRTYDVRFSKINKEWSDVQKVLAEAIGSIRILLVNSKSDESLDYKRYEEDGDFLTVIAVGGLSLSRGLTLEGLMVSYMYRNTKMYDTLMQMGRWFGYRNSYEDICRVWLSGASKGWYTHITNATEELRQQVKQMQRDRLSPEKFGLYVRAHPDALIVTALNKMRDAEQREFSVNYNGRLVETVIVPSDKKITEQNQKVIIDFFKKLNNSSPIKEPGSQKAYFWSNVECKDVEQFLSDFKFHKQIKSNAMLEYLSKVSTDYPYVDVAFISLKELKEFQYTLLDNDRKMGFQKRSVGTLNEEIKSPHGEKGFYVTNKQRVASRGVESVGLTKEQRDKAEAEMGNSSSKNISDVFYRDVRKKPLLMIHLLRLVHQKAGKETFLMDKVPALGIRFPVGDYSKNAKYIVNKVWLEQDMFDDPSEEDDYET